MTEVEEHIVKCCICLEVGSCRVKRELVADSLCIPGFLVGADVYVAVKEIKMPSFSKDSLKSSLRFLPNPNNPNPSMQKVFDYIDKLRGVWP